MNRLLLPVIVFLLVPIFLLGITVKAEEPKSSLRVLFIGNSYTGRHNLSQVVKSMAEAGTPRVNLEVTTVIYGGRTLADHWRLGTQNFVKLHRLTKDEVLTSIQSLEAAVEKNGEDNYAKTAIPRQRTLLSELERSHEPWDVIVLQSYRDDLEGDDSLYSEYAPKFADLAKEQGARVILYETTPTTQNAEPLTEKPDPKPIMDKQLAIARLANRLDVAVAPMSLVALRCQTQRPDLTLRFVNDGHLNQTLAYLTACTIYAAMFDRSPQGIEVDSVTDIRYLNDKSKDKDRDGKPITQKFSASDREDLQRIAWEGYQEFQTLRQK
jgi:hypothetical protein